MIAVLGSALIAAGCALVVLLRRWPHWPTT